MITLVIGTTDSGKSALAEKLCLESGDSERYYIATMKVYDDAGKERIEKHRRARAGKGFITIEKPFSINESVDEMADPMHSTALLECVSNLVGNEMYENPSWRGFLDFSGGDSLIAKKAMEAFVAAVVKEIEYLGSKVNNLVIVSNDYPKDDEDYDDETRFYITLLDLVNEKLKKKADKVIDVRLNGEKI